MRHHLSATVTLLLFGAVSCGRFSLPEDTYEYFTLTSAPEERTCYPEEELIFTFSQPIDTETLSGVTISYDGDPVHHTSVRAEGERLIIGDLLPDTQLSVTFASALKSIEHKPLVTVSSGEIATAPVSFSFTVGPALPAVARVFPSDHARSLSIALRFTGPVAAEHITVSPSATWKTGDDLLLLSFAEEVSSVRVEGLSSPLRPGTVAPVLLDLSEDPPVSTTPIISETPSDTGIALAITASGLVAVSLGDDLSVCEPACTIVRSGLSPDTLYTFELSLYFTDGERKISHTVRTLPAAPHIMVSEVMHTPEGTPEKNFEFVEIYNYGDLDFDLAGCAIDDKGDGVGEDKIAPLIEGDTVLAAGEFALVLGAESTLHLALAAHPRIFFVDDTTIADGGLTSTESVQIRCPTESSTVTAASYNGLFRGAKRGYSVVIAPDGRTCASASLGGSPGEIEYCAP